MTVTVAIANNKGGTGKTSIVVHTAAALARRGLRVLVVDMDPQANASRRLACAWDPASPTSTMSEVIKADKEAIGQAAVLACGWPDPEAELIDVLPSRYDLLNREIEAGQIGAFRRLVKALKGWTDVYDVILIDNRPDLGHIVQMAFAAADAAIIVTEPSFDSIEGARRVADFITKHADDIANPNLHLAGIIVTKYRTNSNEHKYQIDGLKEQFGDLVWDLETSTTPSVIPLWTKFEEADSAERPLSAWHDKDAVKAKAIFDNLARIMSDKLHLAA